MNPLKSDAPLIVYIDVKSPYAFVAIRTRLALEHEVGMPFNWRPLNLASTSSLGTAKTSKGKCISRTRRY